MLPLLFKRPITPNARKNAFAFRKFEAAESKTPDKLYMEKIIQVLRNIAPIPEKDCASFLNILSTIHLNKGEYWIEEGKKNNNVAFLEDGYLRKYYLKDGNEITDYF